MSGLAAAAMLRAHGALLQVRALTRVANRHNEEDLLMFALRATATHVAERCRELRCGREESINSAERAYAKRSLRVRRDRLRNIMTITVELPLESGELLEKALDKARDDELLAMPTSLTPPGQRGRPMHL